MFILIWLVMTFSLRYPRFYAIYKSRVQKEKETPIKIGLDLMRVARMKLSGRDKLVEPAVLDASSVAILSARLLLDLSPASSIARKYEEEQIRSHMRTLYSVSKDLESMVSGSSSEPVIAEAAAQLMHSNVQGDTKPYMDTWDLVVQYVERGLLPQGTVGELLGRVLSIFAMDCAIEGVPVTRDLKYQTPVKVTDYYRELLTDDAWECVRKSTPANRQSLTEESANMTFEEAFADAYLHFSHYGKANDETPLQDHYGWAAWLRGTAILSQLNQMRTDRALPMIFSPSNDKISARCTSMVLEQDKTSPTEDPTTVAIQDAELLGVFTQGQKLPYIAAVHCYGVTKNEGVVAHGPIPKKLRSPANDIAAPRYQINFCGLAAYRGLNDTMKSDIHRMIDGSKNALFNKHPRQEYLHMVRQMLPLLNGHVSATAWFGGLDSGPMGQALSSGSDDGGGGGVGVGGNAKAGGEAMVGGGAKKKGKGKARAKGTGK
jgi:hypothetical protein